MILLLQKYCFAQRVTITEEVVKGSPYAFDYFKASLKSTEEPEPYLETLLSNYKMNPLDLGEASKIDSLELVLQNGLIDSLLFVAEQIGNSHVIASKWIDKKFTETFFNYYKFQKEIYGTLQEVTIKEISSASPTRKKQHYPKYFLILCEVQTQKAKGEGMFEYYQLGKDSFRFHKYNFTPYDYEKVNSIDSISMFFFDAIKLKQYAEIVDNFSSSFKIRIPNKRDFIDLLFGLKLTSYRQFTSRIKYEESGLSIVAYYYLPEEKKYLMLALKRINAQYVIDDLGLIDE